MATTEISLSSIRSENVRETAAQNGQTEVVAAAATPAEFDSPRVTSMSAETIIEIVSLRTLVALVGMTVFLIEINVLPGPLKPLVRLKEADSDGAFVRLALRIALTYGIVAVGKGKRAFPRRKIFPKKKRQNMRLGDRC